jgi:hypothetical protein
VHNSFLRLPWPPSLFSAFNALVPLTKVPAVSRGRTAEFDERVSLPRISTTDTKSFSSTFCLSHEKTRLCSRIRECVFAYGQKGFIVSGCLTRKLYLVVRWSSAHQESCQWSSSGRQLSGRRVSSGCEVDHREASTKFFSPLGLIEGGHQF